MNSLECIKSKLPIDTLRIGKIGDENLFAVFQNYDAYIYRLVLYKNKRRRKLEKKNCVRAVSFLCLNHAKRRRLQNFFVLYNANKNTFTFPFKVLAMRIKLRFLVLLA